MDIAAMGIQQVTEDCNDEDRQSRIHQKRGMENLCMAAVVVT